MKSIRHGRKARDPLLHIEADGVLVNIRVGLTDLEGHHVTHVSISPDDKSRGGDAAGHYWYQDGPRIIRLNPGEEPPSVPEGRPEDLTITPAARGYLARAAAEAREAGVDEATQATLDNVARLGIRPPPTPGQS